ncbi:MAG: hypothetical protein LBS41_01735 [Streptococcaceae bacterium]|nr:hypothetical protein [Streptococcaceae bacterium]
MAQYADKRRERKAAGDDEALRKLPRDSNPNRLKNRDLVDGRPRADRRKFGMSRIKCRVLKSKLVTDTQKKRQGRMLSRPCLFQCDIFKQLPFGA